MERLPYVRNLDTINKGRLSRESNYKHLKKDERLRMAICPERQIQQHFYKTCNLLLTSFLPWHLIFKRQCFWMWCSGFLEGKGNCSCFIAGGFFPEHQPNYLFPKFGLMQISSWSVGLKMNWITDSINNNPRFKRVLCPGRLCSLEFTSSDVWNIVLS